MGLDVQIETADVLQYEQDWSRNKAVD
jgi:hypothetical protein